jgi:molybdenum cofactor cytidylyltransferase
VIAALLLAAGAARRFGAPKLLADVGGKPLIRRSVEALGAIETLEVVVVVAPEHGELAGALHGLPVRFVVNAEHAEGMGRSLAVGIGATAPAAQAVIVALADAPASGAVLHRLVERYRDGGATIVAPGYRGIFAPPVLFDRGVFGELKELSGDHGARAVVERLPDRVARIDVDEPPPVDVDTLEDLARLRRDVHLSR